MENKQPQFWENYVSQQEFIKVTNEINQEMLKLKNKIDSLEEKKANLTDLQQIKQEIAILNAKISEISSDRKDDREIIKSLSLKIENLTTTINNTNLTNVEVKTNQGNTFARINEMREDISNVKKDISSMRNDMFEIKEGLNNSLGKSLTRLFQTNKVFKILTIIVLIMFGMTLISSFLFYTTHGIPWAELEKLFNIIPK